MFLKIANRLQYVQEKISKAVLKPPLLNIPDMACFCTLHGLGLRIPERLYTSLANSEKNHTGIPQTETSKQRLKKLQNVFNLALDHKDGTVFDVEATPHSSHITFSDMPNGDVKTISLTAVRYF